MMNSLDAHVSKWNLLAHPFYQAWSNGTLPVSALQSYAREYGAFIATLPQGWESVGEPMAAAVEVAHAKLWDEFAAALETRVGDAKTAEVAALVATAKKLFGAKATALGALYAFEVQQPATAASKLEGLDTHYASLPAGVRPYFQAHAAETCEKDMILAQIATLSKDEQLACMAACETMSKALWDALTGLHPSC
jgi:pyrroloquinoline-quinone synthase